jgi:hypothetical protein
MTLMVSIIFLLLPVGENLHYKVRFGPFRVGTLDLSINEISVISQESCYHFTVHLKSNSGWRFLFEIDDQLESYARIHDFATLKSFKRVFESGYQKELEANFDYQTMKIFYSDSSQFDLEPETKDLISTWYYFRSLSLKPNDSLSVQVHNDKINYKVDIEAKGPKMVKTGLGKIECIEINPTTQMKQDIGIVYLSNDSKRIPAIIKRKFSFGHIIAVLEEISYKGDSAQ